MREGKEIERYHRLITFILHKYYKRVKRLVRDFPAFLAVQDVGRLFLGRDVLLSPLNSIYKSRKVAVSIAHPTWLYRHPAQLEVTSNGTDAYSTFDFGRVSEATRN